MKGNRKWAICLILAIGVFAVGCGTYVQTPAQTSESGATHVETIFKVPKNSQGNTVEQQNISDRLRVTTDPTKVLWIHLISLDGKIIQRMVVRNKVTSSGKRLEPVHAVDAYDSYYPESGIGSFETDEFLQPDGTYGSSDSYIYWFDTQGRYHQWGTAGGLGYLLTDYPIDIKNPIDEMTGLYNANVAARMWQMEQEDQLRKTHSTTPTE